LIIQIVYEYDQCLILAHQLTAKNALIKKPFFYNSIEHNTFIIFSVQSMTQLSMVQKVKKKESQQIMSALIQVLAYLHSNGFAHRDLKPENILFDKFHRIKLIDFGLAAQSKVSKHFYMICM